jgi:hypothetical protein
MKYAIVNLATDRYILGQQRLRQSLIDNNFNGDFFGYIGEGSVGSPSHLENPYAFKIYAIDKLRVMGYTKILWLDASVYAVKNVQPIFDWIEDKGIFMEEAGHWAGSWTNDATLEYFGITREQAMKVPMYSAGVSGFDFEKHNSINHFNFWYESMKNGLFKGSWDNHRHDMSCGTLVAHQLGLLRLYSKGGHFLSYIGEGYGTPSETSILHLRGL